MRKLPSQVMREMVAECEPLSVHESWKIFLDWRWHSCHTGCVVCSKAHPLDYEGECLYERCQSDSDVGEDGSLDRCAFGTPEECFERYGASVCGCSEGSERCACCVFGEAGEG